MTAFVIGLAIGVALGVAGTIVFILCGAVADETANDRYRTAGEVSL